MRRAAFTLMEVLFVVVVTGILAHFGTDLFLKTYEGYARSIFLNELQTKSAAAVQTIANRLEYRIKDSVVSGGVGGGTVTWVGYDVDGWTSGMWSGVIDLDNPGTTATGFVSPGTTGCLDMYGTGAGNCGLFFIGSNIGLNNEYHQVNAIGATITPSTAFNGQDIYEFYQLANSRYTLTLNGTDLLLRSGDTSPWGGGTGQQNLLVDDVSAFNVSKEGDGIHIRLCLTDNIIGEGDYTVCKDKFVF